uniref:Uncharacterized protein n=1 Tax=Amphiprion percula TaxID=161767 RepID=A0A3P8U9Z2_AMPPE
SRSRNYFKFTFISASRYQPTEYEHAANCATHALWIIPSLLGSSVLHFQSEDQWERLSAWVYGAGLSSLFIISTLSIPWAWKKSHLRSVEHCFHMCDRMVIYFFIAASYAPWLNLRELGPWACHMRWLVWVMASFGTTYVFFFHEKSVPTFVHSFQLGMSCNVYCNAYVYLHTKNIHPSIHPLSIHHLILIRVMGGLESIPADSGEGRGHPRQVTSLSQGYIQRQTITLTFTPTGNLEYQLTSAYFWTVGGSRSTRRKPTHAQGEHANSMQKDPGKAGTRTRDLLAARQQC